MNSGNAAIPDIAQNQ